MGCAPEIGIPMIGCCGGPPGPVFYGLRLVHQVPQGPYPYNFSAPFYQTGEDFTDFTVYWQKVNRYLAIMKAFLDAIPAIKDFPEALANRTIVNSFDPATNTYGRNNEGDPSLEFAGYTCPPIPTPASFDGRAASGGFWSIASSSSSGFNPINPALVMQRIDVVFDQPTEFCEIVNRGVGPLWGEPLDDWQCGLLEVDGPQASAFAQESCVKFPATLNHIIQVPEVSIVPGETVAIPIGTPAFAGANYCGRERRFYVRAVAPGCCGFI